MWNLLTSPAVHPPSSWGRRTEDQDWDCEPPLYLNFPISAHPSLILILSPSPPQDSTLQQTNMGEGRDLGAAAQGQTQNQRLEEDSTANSSMPGQEEGPSGHSRTSPLGE